MLTGVRPWSEAFRLPVFLTFMHMLAGEGGYWEQALHCR